MRGLQIQTMDSTPVPVKAASVAGPSSAKESFVRTWQKEMSAVAAKQDDSASHAVKQSGQTLQGAQTKPPAQTLESSAEAEAAIEEQGQPQESAQLPQSAEIKIPMKAALVARSNATPDSPPDAKPVVAILPGLAEAPTAENKGKHRAQALDSETQGAAAVDAAPAVAEDALAAIQASVAVAAPLLGNAAIPDAASPASASASALGAKRGPQAASDATPRDAASKIAQTADPKADAGSSASTRKPSEQAANAVNGAEAVEGPWTAMAVDHAGGAHANATGVSASASGSLDVAAQPAPAVAHSASASHAGAELQGAALNVNDGASGLTANPGPRILAAGPGQLEIGVMDGTHGWVQIHAQMGETGTVSASLTAGAAAHESLREAVPAMASYLEAEAVSVSKIAVHRAAESSPAMAQPQQGSGQNGSSQQGSGQDRNLHGDRESKQSTSGDTDFSVNDAAGSGYDTGPLSRVSDISPASPSGAGLGQLGWMGGASPAVFGGGLPFGSAGGSGGWLNVLA